MFALATKLGVLLLAAVGFATMWMAVAADVGASMIVIANGMRMIQRAIESASALRRGAVRSQRLQFVRDWPAQRRFQIGQRPRRNDSIDHAVIAQQRHQ